MKPEGVDNISCALSPSLVVPSHPRAKQADRQPGDDEEGGDARHRRREDHRGETEIRFIHQNSWDWDKKLNSKKKDFKQRCKSKMTLNEVKEFRPDILIKQKF